LSVHFVGHRKSRVRGKRGREKRKKKRLFPLLRKAPRSSEPLAMDELVSSVRDRREKED